MNRNNNIYIKAILLLILIAGWGGGAWAQRFMPTFAANESTPDKVWHYIIFPNNNSDKIYANTNNNQLNWTSSSTTPTDHFRWYLIGSQDDFILKTVSGLYAYTTNTGTGTEVQYQVTTDASRATHFNLRNGNNANTWAIHRKSGGDKNSLNHRNNYGIMEWSVDNGSSVIFSNPNELIKYSDAPSATAWAANTHWFSMRNNRNNQGANNRKYITTSAGGVNDQCDIMPTLATMPNDRGNYWCFVGSASGFVIQNAAYGPDFVLAISGNQNNATVKMVRKDDVPTGYTYNFTAVDNSVVDDGSFAYAFRLGTSGNTHIHVTQGHFIIYTHSAISGGDTGSAFKLTNVPQSTIDALTAYDVYNVQWKGVIDDFTVDYAEPSKTFGKRGKANHGSYLIVESGSPVETENFTISNSAYTIVNTSVTPVAGHFFKDLLMTLRDKAATELWTVKIIKDDADLTEYEVTNRGNQLRNDEVFYWRPNVAPKAIDFTINAPADKFVWGPVINTNAKTVTYEVRDLATDIPSGWYQLQLSDANANAVKDKIKDEEGNINTKANTLYLAPAIHEPGNNKIFKVTGVPQYAGESATYVYVRNNGGGSYNFINPITGFTISGSGFTFANGHLTKPSNWSYEATAHPLEGPYLQLSGSESMTFNVSPAKVTGYAIYRVNIEGVSTVGDIRLRVNSSDVLGNKAVANGGYIFMREGAPVPQRTHFAVTAGNVSVERVTIGDKGADGVTPITITVYGKESIWNLRITGEAMTASDRITYGGIDYENGAHIALPKGAVPSITAFKTTVTDRFVWGPIIDENMQTVTFEVRNTATTLTPGKWYQMVLRDKPGQVYNSGVKNVTSMVEGVNAMSHLRQQSSYIYPITANATDWPLELSGATGEDMRANTFIYVKKKSGDNITLMMQNGMHLNQNGQGYSSDNNSAPLIYQPGSKAFKWNSNALPWENLRNNVGVGNTGAAQNGNMEYFITEVPVKAYKVIISGNAGTLVYNGEAELIGSNRTAHGRFFFAKEGQMLEGEGSTIDISKFALRGVNGTITGITASTSNGITTLNVTATTPTYAKEIIHVQNRYYDYLETDPLRPTDGFIEDGQGWNVRTGTNGVIREQNTSVFEIPIYMKQGTSFTSYMPTNELKSYQRWYDWDSDGQVSSAVFTPTWTIPDAQTYINGKLSGDSYGGYHNDPKFTLPLGMESYNIGLDLARFGNGGTRGNGSLVEPTIGMRVVYQIRDAKLMANAIKTASDAGKFYEVHDIALPNVQYGSRASRLEDRTLSTTLPLDMDLNNYWGYNNGVASEGNLVQLTQDSQLRVELVAGGAPIQNVMMIPGSGNARSGNISRTGFNTGHFVLFQYPDDGYIDPNSTATINVYMKSGNTEYKLVQFNLTFIGNAHPLVVTELRDSYRHPDALAEQFGAPVTELTFDQEPNWEYSTTEGGVVYPDYRYPLDYKGASYAFGARNGRSWAASRGEYALTSMSGSSTQTGTPRIIYYPVVNYLRSMKDPSTAFGPKEEGAYQLYIDAADQPGKIASIELKDALCAGSRLYCYGYIGCTSGGTSYHPTSVLINVMGINKNTGKEELIYSYCPGIITLRGYAEDGRTIYSTAMGSYSSYSQRGGGEDRNYWAPWQQIGFSFAIGAETASKMAGYTIQIMNNAYNSTGGDTMLDDFQIFVKKPGAEVANTTPLCSDQIRHIKVITEYETLLEATGEDTNHDGLMNVGFCFLDKEVYDRVLEENADKDAEHGYPRTSPDNKYNKAFGEALMGNRTLDRTNKDHAFHNFDIIRDGQESTIYGETKVHYYTDIPQYSFKESGDDVVYRDSIRGERYIVFKESVAHGEPSAIESHKWTAGKSYYLLFSTATISETHVNNHDLGCTVFNLDDNRCAVLYEFTVAPPVTIKGDAEEIKSGDEVQACAGQTATLTVNLNGRTDTKDVIIKNLNYDWWMSAPTHEVYEMENGVPVRDGEGNRIPVLDGEGHIQVKEYNTVPATLQNYMNVTWGTYSADHAHLGKQAGEPIYLSDALLEFRRAYPNATDLVGVVPIKKSGDTVEYDLTQDLINCVAHFLEPDENGYPPLLLMKKEMNLTLGIDYADENKVVHFVVIPIAPSIYSVDEDAIYCPDPQELKVKLLNDAPSLANGFSNMEYPDVLNNVPVRIGLKQIENVRHRASGSQRTLTIPLRKPKFAYAEGTKMIKSIDDKLYLVGSDDPEYKRTDNVITESVEGGTFAPTEDEIEDMFIDAGVVKTISVMKGATNPTMQIIFNGNARFREGYTYTFKVKYFEVKDDDERDMACEGSFVFDMKVVPEYQVWTAATGNSDWTNDRNWARADRNDLLAGATATGNGMPGATALNDAVSYPSNEVNTTAGSFVPMYFTNVLIKDNADAVELYKGSDFKSPEAGTRFLEGLNSTATQFIAYDMEVTPVSAADRTAFNYDCNYQCELFDTYVANGITFTPGTQMGNAHYLIYNKAWVEYSLDADRWYTLASPLKQSFAGDWYSPTAGAKQLTPHFYDINYREALNDRFRPAYYQRSWDREGNNIVYEKSGSKYDSYVRADWSNVYNDAKVNYSAGGFSVKAELDYMAAGDRPADNKVLVRLPKADTSYTYYDINGQTGAAANAQLGSRTQSYRLLSDDLKADGTGTISMSVTNVTADNNFLLLSNPFMAAMDMDEFFDANTDLEAQYWIVDADRQAVSVRSTDGTWITTSDADGKYVAPLQGFFVKKKSSAPVQNAIDATYTAAMQTVVNATPTTPGVILRKPSTRAEGNYSPRSSFIRLISERDGAMSTALIILADDAHDGFVAGEDCEAFIDGNIYEHPTVYTSASGQAQTINVRKSLNMVPVGMISADDSPATLRFDLSAMSLTAADALYLYDSEDDSYTEISDDMEVTMSGNSSGRYFITTSIEDSLQQNDNDVTRKGVYTTSGIYLGDNVKGLRPGLYIVDGVKMQVK